MLGYISLNSGNNYIFGYEQSYRLQPNKLYYINMLNSHYKSWENISSHLYNYEKCFAQNGYCQSLIREVVFSVSHSCRQYIQTYNGLWTKRFRGIGKYKQFNVLFHAINEGIGCRKNLSRSLLVVITQSKQLLICFLRCDHRVSAAYDWIYV